MGRRKIDIEPLTDERNRTVTFVKRKTGLFKKAHELAVLCQVDLAVIIIGPQNKVYEFSSIDTDSLLTNFQNLRKKTQDEDSEASSSSPPAKKLKPNLSRPNLFEKDLKKEFKEDQPQRPVLRVQIPKDSLDGEKTLSESDKEKKIPPLMSKFSYSSYRSPDSRKPPVLLPIHAKSQLSSPADTHYQQNYFNNTQSSPTYPNILPTPILNQVLNSTFEGNDNPSNPTENTSVTSGSGVGPGPTSGPGPLPNSALPNNNPSLIPSKSDKSRTQPFRPPLMTNFSESNPQSQSDTPFSNLRNVYEMFPSPLNFYHHQDWPQGNTGMTPIHSNAQNYFMNMLPSGGGGGVNTSQPHTGNPNGNSTNLPPGAPLQSGTPNGNPANYNNQNRQSLGSFPSPLQFLGQNFGPKKN